MIRLSGRLRSSLIIGMQGIRARKLRTLLSMMSLFLGVLAVVSVQAGAEIAERTLLANVELTMGKDGTRQLHLPLEEAVIPTALDTLRGRSDAVALTSVHAVIGEPGVTPVNAGGVSFDQPSYGPVTDSGIVCDPRGCRRFGGEDRPRPPGQAIELWLTAMTGDLRQFRPFRLESGAWLNFSSAPSLSPGIVLNKEAAKGFGRYRVPAEMHIEGAVANATPRIVGVVDDGSSGPYAYVRADELLNWFPVERLSGPFGSGLEVLLQPDATLVEQTLRARLAAAGVPAEQIISRSSTRAGASKPRWH